MGGTWIGVNLLLLALIVGGPGLVGVSAKTSSRKWNGTLRFLQKMVGQAPCKGGRCTDEAIKDGRTTHERFLMQTLLAYYDKLPRPVVKDAHNVTVHFSASLMELLNHAEASGRVGMRINTRMWWRDPNLIWDPEMHGGVQKFTISPDLIWTPDIGLYNGVGSSVNGNVKLTVYSDGSVLWMPPSEFQVTCSYAFRTDSWRCPLRFRSWSYDSTQLDIVPFKGKSDLDKSELMYSSHWAIIGNTGERKVMTYACCDEQFPTMEYSVGFRMKIGHPTIGKRSVLNAGRYDE